MSETGLPTEGRRLLNFWLDEPGRSQKKLGDALGIVQSSVSLWARGQSRPEPHLREAVEIVTGIPRAAWTTTEERAAVEVVRSRIIDPNAIADDPPAADPAHHWLTTGEGPVPSPDEMRAAVERARAERDREPTLDTSPEYAQPAPVLP